MKTKIIQKTRKTLSLFLMGGILLPAFVVTPLSASAAGTNLIQNPSAETGTATPTSWLKGVWGTNTAVFTYPAPGIEGAKSMRIDMTAYTSGDAKWYFKDVPVKPSTKYVFSDSYISDVPTEADVRYKLSTGGTKIVLLGTYPASTATSSKQFTITTPANAVSLTVFHLIAKQGYLVTDNYSLTESTVTPPIDTIAPVVSITSPTASSSIVGTFTATATSTDNVGVSGVRFILDGTDFGSEITAPPYSLSINTTTGAHTLSARSRDAAGNIATSSPVSFSVTTSGGGGGDTTVPTVAITNPTNGTSQSGTITVSANAADNVAVAGVKFLVDGTAIGTEDVVSPYSFTWNTASSTDGTHTLTAVARDTSNNRATSSPIAVTVTNIITPPIDTILPNVNISFPLAESILSGTTTISANATDNVAVAGVTFFIDGVAFGPEDILSLYQIDWNTASIANGPHTLTAVARDTSNNKATSSPIAVTVTNIVTPPIDTILPNVNITLPLAGSILSGTTTISANATDNIAVAGVTFLIDDIALDTEDTASPYNFTWNTASSTDGTHTITAIARDTFNNRATSSPITVTLSNPVIDTTPPSVHLILPLPGTAVASTTPLSFGATDNVSVAGVTLFVDGVPIGSEDTVAPYDFLWNTTTYTNDSHIISAQARDAAGNMATSTGVDLTVNNIVLPPNLVPNPSFETEGANGNPENWFRGGWGTNTATFTYPSVGLDGNKAVKIDVSNYVDGDAKWYFTDIPVTPGETYTFTHSYKSDAISELTIRYQTPTGVSYKYITSLPVTPYWQTETYNVLIPAGATALTIFHSLSGNGTLEVDSYSFTLGAAPFPPEKQFLKGLISFSFDDGWITQYQQAFPILNAAGFKGTFYIISQETLHADQTERIINPSFETEGANGNPENWFRGGWGTNTATFTYPTPGGSGGNAAKVTVSDYVDGDAKWFFGDTVVLPNETYTLSDSYQSDAESVITIRYKYFDGTVKYVDVETLPSTSGAWQNFTKKITIPTNVDTMTVFHLLRGNGSLTVDNYSLIMIPIYMNTPEMLELQAAGHELGGHTQTHVSLSTVASSIANAELVGSWTDLLAMGAVDLKTMAYPYGDYNAAVETMAKNAGYVAARSVDRGFNDKSTNKYELKIQQMDRTTTMSDVQHWVAEAATTKTWLILMFHQEDENIAHDLGVTPEFLQQIVDYVHTANVDVVTVKEGVAQMNP